MSAFGEASDIGMLPEHVADGPIPLKKLTVAGSGFR
jgi:hypothetical protein